MAKTLEPEKTNRHRLEPSKVLINYDNADSIGELQLPRKYTWVSHHVSVRKEYDQNLMNRAHDETYVIGEWIRLQTKDPKDSKPKYEIHIKVNISTEKSPNVEARSKYFRDRLGLILEEIAFAETSLLKTYPSFAATKIMINFVAKDPSLNKTEYWHRLGYWTPESMRDKSEVLSQVKAATKDPKDPKVPKDSKKPMDPKKSMDPKKRKKSELYYKRRNSDPSSQSSRSLRKVQKDHKNRDELDGYKVFRPGAEVDAVFHMYNPSTGR